MSIKKAIFEDKTNKDLIKLLLWIVTAIALLASALFPAVFRFTTVAVLIIGITFISRKLSALQKMLEGETEQAEEETEDADGETNDLIVHENPEEAEAVRKAMKEAELGRTQMLEGLFTRANMSESEKEEYRDQISEKDQEISKLQLETQKWKEKVQQAISGTTKWLKTSSSDTLHLLIECLDDDDISNASLQELNLKLQESKNNLSDTEITLLERDGYVDHEFKLTRTGYKELKKKAESEEDPAVKQEMG
ncbi:hypothetical protein [Bacillus marinisedimentorum]|uniref:hypothetical protein n=1 Tax=Bacillus marinisedimentorum TaxID=1821260 RepID=UPI0007DF4709|nr:hypothetical protein [Bacillus marinisedimentorum]